MPIVHDPKTGRFISTTGGKATGSARHQMGGVVGHYKGWKIYAQSTGEGQKTYVALNTKATKHEQKMGRGSVTGRGATQAEALSHLRKRIGEKSASNAHIKAIEKRVKAARQPRGSLNAWSEARGEKGAP